MSKTEMMRQSAVANSAKQAEELAQRMRELDNMEMQSAQQLAEMLEPLAQAMANLTEETRKTLEDIQAQSQKEGQDFSWRSEQAMKHIERMEIQANEASNAIISASNSLGWGQYFLVMGSGVVTAALTSVLFLWAMPQPQIELDAKLVAEQLKPAVIEALKPSKGK